MLLLNHKRLPVQIRTQNQPIKKLNQSTKSCFSRYIDDIAPLSPDINQFIVIILIFIESKLLYIFAIRIYQKKGVPYWHSFQFFTCYPIAVYFVAVLMYQYFLEVVPTTFKTRMEEINTYQYAVTQDVCSKLRFWKYFFYAAWAVW